jgi:tRNA (guanine26-N2/guanine27-N2)-dimethyltransferase
MKSFPLHTVSESKVRLEVPELCFRSPGKVFPRVPFYSPYAEFGRDISVSVVQVIAKDFGKLRVCDPLAGVGVRGIRYAKEVTGISKVVVNDRLPEAFEFIRRNVELNDLASSVDVYNEDANILLRRNQNGFDFVDLDPFGSPSLFLDSACIGLARKGVLALTATDTAPLSGANPRACVRKYGAVPFKTEYHRELGIRILIGFCQRVAGKYELALKPLLVHATRHYFRVYLLASKGARLTDEVLAGQGYVSHCRNCGRRMFTPGLATELPSSCECGDKPVHTGPLWLGKIMDRIFIHRVFEDLANRDFKSKREELTLLNLCAEEADGPPTFYDTHELAKRTKASPPKTVELITKLRESGYFASGTHFSGTGFKTNAPLDDILEIFKSF